MAINCTSVNNRAYIGAGVALVGSPTLTGCVVRANTTNGVAITAPPGGVNRPVLRDCLIADNLGVTTGTRSGGGMYIISANSTTLVVNCTISNNSSGVGGGFNDLRYGGFMSNCTIRGNSAPNAGGGNMSRGRLYNCLFVGNRATVNYGGGMILGGGTADCCTVVGNIAVNNAGGINVNNATPYICNSIIISNSAASATTKDFRFQSSGEQSLWFSCYGLADVTPPAGRGNITSAPRFLNYPAGNYRLPPTSPCVNAGTNHTWMVHATDLDGRERISGDRVDMGAYEYYYVKGTSVFCR
jgi:hypothetical protein